MINKYKDVRLHGHTGDGIEYFVLVAGTESYQRFFFSVAQDDKQVRVFAPGNELVIDSSGIAHQGNGGYFCEYMFGVDHASSDLAKQEIINRLVMYGAHYGDEASKVKFSENTKGTQSFEQIFFEGNAVSNYFFFINSPKLSKKLKTQQEEIVRMVGKNIKRNTAVGDENVDALVAEIFPLLQESSAQLYIVKLINSRHREYRDLFKKFYFSSKKISEEDFSRLVALANEFQIDRYQQERMRIDVMYRHPANKRIVDEYRSILLECSQKGEISSLDNARLTRLKTLSVRNKIPGALFYTLDEMLKRGHQASETGESEYVSRTREIIQGIFLKGKNIDSSVTREDMYALILAKKAAVEMRDHLYDQIMLDASKECDEMIRDGADPSLMDGFSYIITYLDRFDSVSNVMGQLAFMENVRITEEMLHSIMEHKAAFDNLKDGCFHELFVRELFINPYLGKFGRKKVECLVEGLNYVETAKMPIENLNVLLQQIDDDERLSLLLLEYVRDRIRNFYSRFATKAEQDALRREVTEELRSKRLIQREIPDHLFNEVIVTIRKEAMYIHTLLPAIIADRDVSLREDFLQNSGLDRFYVEELEREYYEKNGLDLEDLYQIRKGLS